MADTGRSERSWQILAQGTPEKSPSDELQPSNGGAFGRLRNNLHSTAQLVAQYNVTGYSA
jgi:hypothetical protein